MKKVTSWKILIFFVLVYIFLLYVYSYAFNLSWRLDSDYDSVISSLEFTLRYFLQHATLPEKHTLAGFGIPLRGDPTMPLYNPIFLVLLLLFGFDLGWWVIIGTILFSSGLAMYYLTINIVAKRGIAVWAGLLYMLSGVITARIAAGHIAYVLTYPLWPIVLHYLFQSEKTYRQLIVYGAICALFFLSGDLYGTIYMTVIIAVCEGYFLITRQKVFIKTTHELGIVVLAAILFSSPKLYFVFLDWDFLRQMTRIFPATFGEGSIHLPFTILPFILPWRTHFYDRPLLQRTIGFHFNWYEYYAYLSPFPFIFLLGLSRISSRIIVPTSICTILGLLFVSQKYWYSPFHYLENTTLLDIIRVPQRVYIPLVSLVILLLAIGATQLVAHTRGLFWRHVTHIMMVLTIITVYITSFFTFAFALEPLRHNEYTLIKHTAQFIPRNAYILNLTCCTQRYLIQEEVHVLNYYAGWQHKEVPTFFTNGVFEPDKLNFWRPQFILAYPQQSFTNYQYTVRYTHPLANLWETTTPNLTVPNHLMERTPE